MFLSGTFATYKRLKFHLAPPIFNIGNMSQQRPKKYAFGEWVLVFFKLLVLLRPLRDSKFDFFGMSRERRLERKLIESYEKDLVLIFKNFNEENRDILLKLAANPASIKGFGLIKEKAIHEAFCNRTKLMAKFQQNQ